MKAFPHPPLLEFLAKQHIGFDCASLTEAELVKKAIDGNQKVDVVFANPVRSVEEIKATRHLPWANTLWVVDSAEELSKLEVYNPGADCLIRIKGHESNSSIKFNSKFGCTLEEATQIMDIFRPQKKNWSFSNDHLNLKGFSFHVGSKCSDPTSIASTVEDVLGVLLPEVEKRSLHLSVIDIGGGFDDADSLDKVAAALENLKMR